MFETLFGGALVIIVLYFLLQAFGVSNYWRGVISGVLPVIGYLALSTSKWPGGDVISMHMAVYLATATVLTVIGARKRGEVKRLHWGPKVIMIFFLALFVIDGTLLVISGQGVPQEVAKWLLPPAKKNHQTAHTAFAGVVTHGEEAAKAGEAEVEQAEDEHPPVYEKLETFTVNLADQESYLQTDIQLLLGDASLQSKIKERMPEVRDALIRLLSSKTAEELALQDGKDALANEILQTMNDVLKVKDKSEGVKKVLFAAFIIQS